MDRLPPRLRFVVVSDNRPNQGLAIIASCLYESCCRVGLCQALGVIAGTLPPPPPGGGNELQEHTIQRVLEYCVTGIISKAI